jgi:hypothetical protein
MNKLVLGVLAYLVPTFVLGFVWHLVLFKHYYDELAIYRSDVIIPFGLLAMTLQGVLFTWVYEKSFGKTARPRSQRALIYATFGAALSWSFTTIAVAAKNVMSSVPDYVLIETGYTVAQWALVGPLTVFALGDRAQREAPTSVPKSQAV